MVPNRYNAVGVDCVDNFLLLVGCVGTDVRLIVGVLCSRVVVKSIRWVFPVFVPFVLALFPPLTPFVAAQSPPLAGVVLIVVLLLR